MNGMWFRKPAPMESEILSSRSISRMHKLNYRGALIIVEHNCPTHAYHLHEVALKKDIFIFFMILRSFKTHLRYLRITKEISSGFVIVYV